MGNNPFRNLPSVHEVLQRPAIQKLGGQHAHDLVVETIRQELTQLRERVSAGDRPDGEAAADAVAARVSERLGVALRAKLRSVINATGIILHTNLGRAPIADEAARAVPAGAKLVPAQRPPTEHWLDHRDRETASPQGRQVQSVSLYLPVGLRLYIV